MKVEVQPERQRISRMNCKQKTVHGGQIYIAKRDPSDFAFWHHLYVERKLINALHSMEDSMKLSPHDEAKIRSQCTPYLEQLDVQHEILHSISTFSVARALAPLWYFTAPAVSPAGGMAERGAFVVLEGVPVRACTICARKAWQRADVEGRCKQE
eukprot:311111-Rhodomonas_salina.1